MYQIRRTTLAVWGLPVMLMVVLVKGSQEMGLIFTQTDLEKTIPWDFPAQTDILLVPLMFPPCSEEQTDDVTCYIEITWSNCSNTELNALEYPFRFNQENKSLFWERSFTEKEVKDIGEQCDFNLAIECGTSNETDFRQTTAVIKVISSDPDNVGHCINERHQNFQVYENTENVVIGNIAPLPPALSTGRLHHYTISPSGLNKNRISPDHLIVSNSTGDIVLQKYFDREALSSKEIRFVLKCFTYTCDTSGSCQYADDTKTALSKIVTVSVLDVNDNGPVIVRKKNRVKEYLKVREYSITDINKWRIKTNYTIYDSDTKDVNQYEAYMLGNYSGVFGMSGPSNIFSVFYTVEVTRPTNMSLLSEMAQFAFDVVFQDVTFCNVKAGTQTSKAVFSVKYNTPPPTPDSTLVTTTKTTTQVDSTISNSTGALPFRSSIPRNPEVTRIHSGVNNATTYFVQHLKPVYIMDPSYTRVITLGEAISDVSLHQFSVMPKGYVSDIFNVTHKEGIVYVINTELLKSAGDAIQNLTLHARLKQAPATNVMVLVEIEISSTPQQNPSYSQSCSFHHTHSECSNHSGAGSRRCEWREDSDGQGMSATYETCSPDLTHCPNRHCDELELQVPDICPQDCTVDVKLGLLNTNLYPNRGILQGSSPCWCSLDYSCTCMKALDIYGSSSRDYHIVGTRNKGEDVTTLELNTPGDYYSMSKSPDTSCDTSCKMSILGAFLSVLMIVVATLTCWMFRKKAQSMKLKHIASNVSLSGVTSDYHEETEVHEEMTDNRYAPIGVNLKLKADPKWEISRSNIVLEKVLGEGEFGKVLKAQILDLPGKKGYSPAAVKMLKEQATIAEFRDLLSEYNLLKDVDHKNVIKLLGACTLKGPFMMIVEYCKHGSLKSYLQNCRCQGEVTESGCVIYKQHNSLGTLVPVSDSQDETPIGSPRHSNISTEKTPFTGVMNESHDGLTTDDVIAVLTAKDLISFAWQIANGMQYLNEMKLVHRDLAARNILVGASKVVKISDFGLSRDIYEEDHYMKKSKGRVPVKWMAPESLYDHVYTSRSDVWSLGIVLWEIVTLGATPYPGVLPERLYNILKNGYRMSRPSGCSNQIFDIMSKCWQFEPMSRPSFKELSNIFEKMLKDKSDYLDLNSICNEDFSSSDDEEMSSFEAQQNLNNDTRNEHQDNMNIMSKSNYLVPVQSSGNRHPSQNINFSQIHHQNGGEEFGRKSKHAFNPLYSSDVTPVDSPDSRQSRRALVEANNAQNGALLAPPDFNSNHDINVHRSCPSLNGVLPNGQVPKGMVCIFKNGKVKNKTTKNRRGNEQGPGTKPLVYADIGSNPSVSEDIETEI